MSGQGKPLTAYTITKRQDQWTADLAWENPELSLSFSDAVLVGDAIFSLSAMKSGQLFWADARTGKTLWVSSPRQADNAAIIRAGDLLFVLQRRFGADGGTGEPWHVRADQDLHRGKQRDMACTIDLG